MIETSASFVKQETGLSNQPIFLSEILSALSFVLDLTEGAVHGHALRSCLLGMRIAEEAQVPAGCLRDLYYALLLKDIGCSSNAGRICQIVGGDDRAFKAGIRLEDWTSLYLPKFSKLRLLWKSVLPEADFTTRVARIVQMGRDQDKNNEEMITLRCDRGASIVKKLGMGEAAAQGVRSLDEHWCGNGYPEHLRGEQIPLAARIIAVAQHLDAFATDRGQADALSTLKERSGSWFDPNLVKVAVSLHQQARLWRDWSCSADQEETRRAVHDYEPGGKHSLGADQIDQICEAFADVVDAKSPFTFRHSIGVANSAFRIALRLGLPADRIQLVRRAALLHDIGKVGISNSILDKPGKLTADEWRVVQQHPGMSRRILERVTAFREVAILAGEHHEKRDGTGYPRKLVAEDTTVESRLIAVADVYDALSQNRPYRPGLELDEIVFIMNKELPHKLDQECFDALLSSLASQPLQPELALPFNLRPHVTSVVASVTRAQDIGQPAFRAGEPERQAASSHRVGRGDA